MHYEGVPNDERQRLLSAFLTEHRHRIDPAITVLGDYPRRIEAIGNPVTPCEIADATGINRRWYELAERGERTRTSADVLRALGDVFRLNNGERGLLLRLAMPYLDPGTPRDESLEMRDTFASVRDYLRKLNACSTTDEVLTLAEDTAACQFPQASYLRTSVRLPDGRWSFHGDGTGRGSRLGTFASNAQDVIAPIFASDPLGAAVITCFPQVSSPGGLLTYDDYNESRLAGIVGKAFPVFKHLHQSMVVAVIRSRSGFVAHLYLGDFRMTYDNDVDRALISTIADFASLAASA